MRLKAIVAYDGTGYGGFQRQKNAPSIQEVLEQTLARLTQVPTRIVASGRTDAGVHADGQVVAFDTHWSHPVRDLHRGLNALLPKQIAVLALEETDVSFHPRYDALRRGYRYTIYRGAVRNPLVHRFSYHVSRQLDLESMQIAASYLVGTYDFSAFGSPPQGNNAVREVFRATWSDQDVWLYFDVEANAFLYRMVRMLVGTLLRVGYGVLTPDEFSEMLRTQDRRRAGPAIAAQGLCLKHVIYNA